jgi:hypothetical protein
VPKVVDAYTPFSAGSFFVSIAARIFFREGLAAARSLGAARGTGSSFVFARMGHRGPTGSGRLAVASVVAAGAASAIGAEIVVQTEANRRLAALGSVPPGGRPETCARCLPSAIAAHAKRSARSGFALD